MVDRVLLYAQVICTEASGQLVSCIMFRAATEVRCDQFGRAPKINYIPNFARLEEWNPSMSAENDCFESMD